MADKKFAFASGRVSVAFILPLGLGDCVVARKIFDAVVELAPHCIIDTFCLSNAHFYFAKAFLGDSKNLNLILPQHQNKDFIKNYDLALKIEGTFAVFPEIIKPERIQSGAPALFQSLIKIVEYNKRNIYPFMSSFISYALHNVVMAKILRKNYNYFLSCGGALPIREDRFGISLSPEYKSKFDNLKLDHYITIYTDIEDKIESPKIKTWSIQYLREYVYMVKKEFPEIEILQVEGKDSKQIDNVDRYFLGEDLELTKYILANSLLQIGCEGGLIHLATALGTKCIVLFGSANVYYHGCHQNINLVSDVCGPCIYTWGDGNLRECGRGAKEPPCMLSITPKQVFEATRNFLNHLEWKNNT